MTLVDLTLVDRCILHAFHGGDAWGWMQGWMPSWRTIECTSALPMRAALPRCLKLPADGDTCIMHAYSNDNAAVQLRRVHGQMLTDLDE